MTLQRAGGAAAFSDSAGAYEATMTPALRPVARAVVRRARLEPAETILDVGTGTGTAAGLAAGAGRRVIGVDAASGMLAVARRAHRGIEFVQSDFTSLPIEDASVDVVLAVHALLFAPDRVAALHEWRRVARPGGRLSLSVPGPGDRVPIAVLGDVYRQHGLTWGDDYPNRSDLASWAEDAGWDAIETAADPSIAIRLADEAHVREWLRVGARGRATSGWTEEQRERFVRDLMSALPGDPGGGYRLPFGALYLSARRPR